MSLTIRTVRNDDAPALAALAARTFPLACPPELPREAVEQFIRENLGEDSFGAYLADPAARLLVGLDADRRIRAYTLLIEGTSMDDTCSALILHRPTWGISKFYLDADLHGAGGATRLLDAVIERARQHGLKSLWLATNEGNERARRFYVRSGFRDRGEREFIVGGVTNRDVVLELPLDADRPNA